MSLLVPYIILWKLTVDGTFETCPHLFYRIFSIHIINYGQNFPMVYPNKQQSTDNHMLMVKEAALDHGLDLTPSSVLSDFEQALIHLLRLSFPMAEHRHRLLCYKGSTELKVESFCAEDSSHQLSLVSILVNMFCTNTLIFNRVFNTLLIGSYIPTVNVFSKCNL